MKTPKTQLKLNKTHIQKMVSVFKSLQKKLVKAMNNFSESGDIVKKAIKGKTIKRILKESMGKKQLEKLSKVWGVQPKTTKSKKK